MLNTWFRRIDTTKSPKADNNHNDNHHTHPHNNKAFKQGILLVNTKLGPAYMSGLPGSGHCTSDYLAGNWKNNVPLNEPKI